MKRSLFSVEQASTGVSGRAPYKEAKVSWVGVELNCRGREESGRQCPRRLKVADGLEVPDRNGRTEQTPVKFIELTHPQSLS